MAPISELAKVRRRRLRALPLRQGHSRRYSRLRGPRTLGRPWRLRLPVSSLCRPF
uniref:Macaca fascicularis brain cDNA clone: QflA-21607, similar to human hypothetical protein BC008207 (LOC92345), mRNA, RefSeq: NM_138386.1 n=1 Tax=Macaca fascicularis TaxID=9541 RepID=I7GMD3_MACFA|nr:unnamed protein product [Macaca fascicularis]